MLSRPSTRHVLSLGVAVLTVIAPVSEPAGAAGPADPPSSAASAAPAGDGVTARDLEPASRSLTRRAPSTSATAVGVAAGVAVAAGAAAAPPVRGGVATAPGTFGHGRWAVGRRSVTRPAVTESVARRPATPVRSRRAVGRRALAPTPRMARVVAWAWAQRGKPYRRGAAGPHAFDCSGFTMRAYRLAGYRLPHSSRGQAARARPVRRWLGRPGDLVVGPGHVGVYMGRGMMVDAGTPRTGVVYRRLYAGLRIERL